MKVHASARFLIVALLLQTLILPSVALAQDSKQADIYAAIRKEGMENSKIMNTLHYFTDLYGPRLTGSPDKVAPLSFNEHLGFHEAKEQVLEACEREYLSTLLKRCEGNISRAARESGLHRKSIERLLKKYQLDARELAR